MIGFLIKKTFFDLWDNLFRLAIVNLGFIISAAIPILLPTVLADIPLLALVVILAGTFWCILYLVATALSVKSISDYGSFGYADFVKNLKEGLPTALLIFITAGFWFLLAYVALPFYTKLGTMVGLFAASLVFWTLVILLMAFQYLLPIRARLDRKAGKILKKSFILFFDNPLFSIFLFIHNLIILVLSFFLAFLAPGPAGILLFLDEALRLRLLKYDWLEAHPEADRRHIPWEELLAEDREKTGTRSLRSFIFPWKD
ncbi:hypothetical protein [Gracilinema caldarium]|uniref:Uncharacterized protein n=1 Tax=Gracilinema caldarium (strain ATCC 51460 / DSM 7334 / H1) TaxID=744872 RepID=F8EZN4_GRAC1|nr:hypothetical protein [Gracilinema caldarium]AEJ20758.1 hypothetical protein Spica_2660 [Gracilinema caldarium DSM 7334]